MTIKARPLTADAFAPYGQVLMGFGQGPERHEFAAKVENRRADAKTNLTFIRGAVTEAPVTVKAMERHIHSNQVFVPLNGTRYLVAVCPEAADGGPDLSALEVFVAAPTQAVNYDTGIWHAPNTVLAEPGEFVMLRHDDGGSEDTELRTLDTPIEIDVAGCLAAAPKSADTY